MIADASRKKTIPKWPYLRITCNTNVVFCLDLANAHFFPFFP